MHARLRRSWGTVVFIALACGAVDAASDAAASDVAGLSAFTVADSIGLKRIVEPAAAPADRFKCSPDGRWCLAVIQYGNLATGYSEYELAVLDIDRIRAAAKTKGDATGSSRVVAKFATRARAGGITGARWLDDASIAFVGRGMDGMGQAFLVDVATASLTQLTHHPYDVAEFDLSIRAGVIVYSAYEPPDWSERNAHGYVVESQPPKYLSLRSSQTAIQEVRHYVQHLGSDAHRSIDLAPSVIAQDIRVAPSGRWAIVLAQPASVPPHWWSEYALFNAIVRLEPVAGEPTALEAWNDPVFGRQTPWLSQFYLVDVDAATSRPLFDAPSGRAIAGFAVKALWSADSSHVVIGNTFLPLLDRGECRDGSRADCEAERRRRSPAIIDYDIASGSFKRIADVLRGNAQLIDLEGTGERFTAGWPGIRRDYIRRRGSWAERRAANADVTVALRIEESLNVPPDIFATVQKKAVRVTDLNPQLGRRSLGTVQEFRWSTPDGRPWLGGLVLPPLYDPGQRYPLVIQTYGFNPREFLVDGPDGKACAFAARMLANRNMMVLQMPVDPQGFLGPQENANQLALLESLIDELDGRDFIDRRRVGLIGYSRTGMHVQHAITFWRPGYRIAAATICDSISNGYIGYINQYGTEYPGMLYPERQLGAPFWANDRLLWLERSPAFNLHLVRTALRIEHLGTYPSDYWDTFVLLKRHHRPVEMIHLPEATHVLTQPFARLASQEGNVDWFDFWLRGYEDPQASKAGQYLRWRALREQQRALDR